MKKVSWEFTYECLKNNWGMFSDATSKFKWYWHNIDFHLWSWAQFMCGRKPMFVVVFYMPMKSYPYSRTMSHLLETWEHGKLCPIVEK